MVMQDGELAQKRLTDRHQQLADAVGLALLDRLERIKLEEATALAAYAAGQDNDRFAHKGTVFVAHLDSIGPQLSWVTDPRVAIAARALAEPVFAARIARGVRAELVEHHYADAVATFRASAREAKDGPQAAYAELLLARALGRTGNALGRASYMRVLRTPLGVRDEHGIPFAFYAAHALAADSGARRAIIALARRSRDELYGTRTLSPPACYAFPALSDSVAARERCAELDRAEVLVQRAITLASWRAPSRDEGARWIAADSGRWLTSVARATSTHPGIVLAVRLNSVATAQNALAGNELHLVASPLDSGRQLGHGIEGIGVVWPSVGSADRDSAVITAFYITALVAILGVVLLGGWVLWLDIQRERRLVQLRSQFVASVSHELKTPLTSIRIFAETLRTRTKIEPRTRDEYLETIERESERLTRLLDDVLDFSRIERGQRTYQLSPQALPVIVERALRTLRFQQHGCTVLFHCDDPLPMVRCDPDAIQQAVLNLVSNAIKYSGQSCRIDLRVEYCDSDVAIVVRDYGIGIVRLHQKRLFEPFYRVPTPENEVTPGTGLGLTLVQDVAVAHGGRMTVESTPGRGSTFTLLLPVYVPAPATIAPEALRSAPATTS